MNEKSRGHKRSRKSKSDQGRTRKSKREQQRIEDNRLGSRTTRRIQEEREREREREREKEIVRESKRE